MQTLAPPTRTRYRVVALATLLAMMGPILRNRNGVALCIMYASNSMIFGSWDFPLCFLGGLFLLGAVCWLVIDPERPVFGETSVPATA